VGNTTKAGIGQNTQVNQNSDYNAVGQSVNVEAKDFVNLVGVAGSGAGGGGAGVGAAADVNVLWNTTSAYIESGSKVSAQQDVTVNADSNKYVNSLAVAGAGGGGAGVSGTVSVITVGSLLDDEAKGGLQGTNEDTGESGSANEHVNGEISDTSKLDMLDDANSDYTSGPKDEASQKISNIEVASYMDEPENHDPNVSLNNTQAFINGAEVTANNNVNVTAKDKTQVIQVTTAGAGGGGAGAAGTLGVTLVHDAAEAFIANEAKVDAGNQTSVKAITEEDIYHVGITGSGGGGAGISGSVGINVVTSDTWAYIADSEVNQTDDGESVIVSADSSTDVINVTGSGSFAGGIAVGGSLATNVMEKETRAFIGRGSNVSALDNVAVTAESSENIINGAVSIRGGGNAVGGVISVNVLANTTEALIGEDD